MSVSTEQMWRELSTRLRGFVRRRVADAEVDDVLQEIFVRVHQGIHSLTDNDRVLAWVYRIARNTIADHFRGARPAGSLETEPAGDELDPQENHNEEVGRWLTAMVPTLPEKYREAVELAEIEGLTQVEVSRRLGLSVSGAKSRLQRGRVMLRRRLLECCHLDFDRRGNVVDYERRGECRGCRPNTC